MTEPDPLEPDQLTWAVLLARWTEFARGALALPEDGEAGLVRQSVTDIIALQAVWFSLQQLDELDQAERAVGVDRAGVLIARHRGAITSRFGGVPLPEDLRSLMEDANQAYIAAKSASKPIF